MRENVRREENSYKVCLVGGWKSGRIENILISLIFVWLGVKSGGMKKVSLYKFTYTLLLKNDV